MYTSVPLEAQFFLFCILSGIISAFLYDLLRISRRIVNVCDAVINAEDIIFFTVSAILVFVAAYLKNSGEIRWQSFIGFGLGIFIYIIVVRNRFLNISTIIIKYIVKIFGVVLSVVTFPIRLIMKILHKPINIIAWYTGKSIMHVKNTTHYHNVKVKILARNIMFMFRKK